ncbi:MAG: RidA family protein, partial [Rhodothermaceae bacterium]|nr:RidA family protein [Rhodothermaceae bacterium]
MALLCPILLVSACAPEERPADVSPPDPPSVDYLRADTTSSFPFSDAVRVGSMLYLSGQIGTDNTGALVAGGIAAETRQTMENIKAVLERNGSSLDDVVKCTVMVENIEQWGDVNAV